MLTLWRIVLKRKRINDDITEFSVPGSLLILATTGRVSFLMIRFKDHSS